MKLSMYLLSIILILSSCSEETTKENNTSKNESVPKIEKHVVDLNEEQFTLEELLKIDKEIPVIEVLVPKEWTQTQISGLGELEILKDVSFKDQDLTSIDLSFLGDRRTVKSLKLENCQVSSATLEILSRTTIEKISLINTPLDKSVIELLKKTPRLKEVESNSPEELKAALPDIKVTKI